MKRLKYNPTVHQYDSIGSTLDHNIGYEMCVSTITEKNNMTEVIDIRPVHLYFGRHMEELCLTDSLLEKINNMTHKVYLCESWDKLTELLKLKPVSVCFNYRELEHVSVIDILNMVRTLSKLVNLDYEIPIAIDVGKNTPISIVKLAQKSCIFGLIPRACEFGWDECAKGAIALWNKIPYWPKHIIDQLPGAKKKETKYKSGEIKLTPRQSQILHLIKDRGASNKVIAKHLNITESTVKLHVSIVLKKFNVKNRTQLALFSA